MYIWDVTMCINYTELHFHVYRLKQNVKKAYNTSVQSAAHSICKGYKRLVLKHQY